MSDTHIRVGMNCTAVPVFFLSPLPRPHPREPFRFRISLLKSATTYLTLMDKSLDEVGCFICHVGPLCLTEKFIDHLLQAQVTPSWHRSSVFCSHPGSWKGTCKPCSACPRRCHCRSRSRPQGNPDLRKNHCFKPPRRRERGSTQG